MTSPSRPPGSRSSWRRLARASVALIVIGTAMTGLTALVRGQESQASAERFVAEVYAFDAVDRDGIAYDHPFVGGFNLPRPQLVDIDGDGDDDLFVQEYSGRLMYFERLDATPGRAYVLRSDRYQDLDVGEWYHFFDVDADGDLDLLGEERFSLLRFFRNEPQQGAPRLLLHTERLLDVDGEPVFSDRQNIPKLVDLDCDGRLDLMVGRVEGTITRHEMVRLDDRGAPVFRHVEDRFQGIEIIGQVLGGPQGQPRKQGAENAPLTLHGANTMAFEDFDADGDLDLFWGDFFEPGVLLIENRGGCRTPSMRSEPRPFPLQEPVATSGYNAPAFGDVDGDGDADMLVGVLGGAFNPNRTTIDNLLWLENRGQRRYEERSRRFVRQIDVGSESVPALADVDGDGDLDVFVGNRIEPDDTRAGRIYLFENVGSASAPSLRLRGTVAPFDDAYHYAPAFGDLDGDGDVDILMGTWDDELAIVINAGDPRSPLWHPGETAAIKLTRGRNATPTLGDIDGDGDLDAFIGESSGELNFYRNVGEAGAPRFELVDDNYLGIDVGRRSAPALADIDADGDLDLLIGSEAEGLALYRNLGNATEARFELDLRFAVEANPFVTPALGDLDGDGDLDLVAGGIGGGLQFFRQRTP